MLDGGPCRVGVESTIVDCTRAPFRILRLGGVGRDELEAAVGEPIELGQSALADEVSGTADEIRVPGALASHYAPRARVVVVSADEFLATTRAECGREELVGVILPVGASREGREHPSLVVLGAPPDVTVYAHDLYRMLRAADEQGLDVVVAVAPDDTDGLGAAVGDRLRRAAAPRPSTATDGT